VCACPAQPSGISALVHTHPGGMVFASARLSASLMRLGMQRRELRSEGGTV
jgi:hypothetical protein